MTDFRLTEQELLTAVQQASVEACQASLYSPLPPSAGSHTPQSLLALPQYAIKLDTLRRQHLLPVGDPTLGRGRARGRASRTWPPLTHPLGTLILGLAMLGAFTQGHSIAWRANLVTSRWLLWGDLGAVQLQQVQRLLPVWAKKLRAEPATVLDQSVSDLVDKWGTLLVDYERAEVCKQLRQLFDDDYNNSNVTARRQDQYANLHRRIYQILDHIFPRRSTTYTPYTRQFIVQHTSFIMTASIALLDRLAVPDSPLVISDGLWWYARHLALLQLNHTAGHPPAKCECVEKRITYQFQYQAPTLEHLWHHACQTLATALSGLLYEPAPDVHDLLTTLGTQVATLRAHRDFSIHRIRTVTFQVTPTPQGVLHGTETFVLI